jgi:Rho GTPase-activating protein 6
LREDFDSGREVEMDADLCPHDAATLLKEFFRDLPDPLLSRELYPAFIQTQRECSAAAN